MRLITVLFLALCGLLLTGCAAWVRPAPLPTELVTPAPEPTVPDLATATDKDMAAYMVQLWQAYRVTADKLLEIGRMQAKP